MENAIVVAILLALVGGIVLYLVRAKKRGESCIGCPYAKQCGSQCNGHCGSMKKDTEESSQ